MRTAGSACIVGIYEHPLRAAPNKSVPQLHAECAMGALSDCGLSLDDVDGYFCALDAPGLGPISMAEYIGLKPRYMDSTELGGASYLRHVAHAAWAVDAGLCRVALITLAGNPRSQPAPRAAPPEAPEAGFEAPYRVLTPNLYGLAAQRHIYEYGTTLEQLAWIKVAASQHAVHNPRALLRNLVTIDEVMRSPVISTPLRRLDCCVVTDGGGAMIVAAPEIARELGSKRIQLRGAGEAMKGTDGGHVDLTYTAAAISGPAAFEQAGVRPADIKYASIYDSFTITALIQLEDLGFCAKGEGGRFVADGNLVAGTGRMPVNTDGGGLCNNHPGNRGGMTKAIEAVRQLRGEAHPAVQVPNCDLALASGIGGTLGLRHGAATIILERMQ